MNPKLCPILWYFSFMYDNMSLQLFIIITLGVKCGTQLQNVLKLPRKSQLGTKYLKKNQIP